MLGSGSVSSRSRRMTRGDAMARILLFGATGGVGHALMERALAEGHHVTAAVRDPTKVTLTHDALDVIAGDATDPEAVRQAVKGHDAVVCALGTGGRGPTTLF